MNSIKQWLEEKGLGKYWKAFEKEEIDLEALPHLTEGMLAQLGLPVGPRARLLAAIEDLSADRHKSAHPGTVETPEVLEEVRPQNYAERRQITVMFCDLVDSTKLATRLDPEDLRVVMQAYQSACAKSIQKYGGHIAQYLGDGVMTYFGWPIAYEDAAERAVRAGLETIDAVRMLQGPEPLSVRVGISTGIVVVAESISGDPSIPSGAIGETPHIAARLQTLAQPNSVLIADSTSRLVSERFLQESLGPQNLKGIVEPIGVFRVHGVREESSRFNAAKARGLTPLVGRKKELDLLEERWLDARDGEGRAVFISGVPGIGKSRIVHELEKVIGRDDPTVLRFQCLPHCAQSAFFPVIRQIERQAEILSSDTDREKLEKLRKLLMQVTQDEQRILPNVAEMMSLPVTPRPGGREQPPQGKAQTLFLLVELLLSLSSRTPVLCILEDAQWIDPSTQELLDLVIQRIEAAKILLLVTCRTDYAHSPTQSGNVSAITISRLNRREVAELAHLCLREPLVPNEIVRRIVGDSDAIPLFVEELARGAEEHQQMLKDSPVASRDKSAEMVPDSLRDSLMVRLDRAPKARSVAQLASVIGREFSYEMLSRLASLNKTELDVALAQLEEGDIIRKIEDRPVPRYAFKHALVCDAAYDSLLKSSRRETHGKAGQVIEKHWPDIVTGQPELLAYHYGHAGNAERALRYWVLGGNLARSRSANLEATGQFQNALEYLGQVPESTQRHETELEIQLSLGLCNVAVKGYSADETRLAFERARVLCGLLNDSKRDMQAVFGLWGHYWMRAKHDRALKLAETLLVTSEQVHDPVATIVGHRSLGSTLFTRGQFGKAQEHLEKAIRMAEQAGVEKLNATYAVDPRIAAQLMLGWDLWFLGYPDRALDNVQKALSLALQQGDPYSVVFSQYVASAILLLRGDIQASLGYAEQSLALSIEHKINLYALYSRFGRGCAMSELGNQGQAIADIQQGIDEAKRSGLGYMHAFMLSRLAMVQKVVGDLDAAMSTLEEAAKFVDDIAGRAWEAEIVRLRGEFLLAADPTATDEAGRTFGEAMAVARKQESRSLELRAATSLARLFQSKGDSQKAYEVLSAVYDRFTEGFQTSDLQTAKELLKGLAAKGPLKT